MLGLSVALVPPGNELLIHVHATLVFLFPDLAPTLEENTLSSILCHQF